MRQDVVDNENGEERVSIFLYVMSVLCFVPRLGVLLAIGFIVYGFATKKRGGKILATVGVLGICVTILFYAVAYKERENAKVEQEFRAMEQSDLTQLAINIEYYKARNGKYPESIETLLASLPKDPTLIAQAMDMSTGLPNPDKNGNPTYFYYQLADADHYYLLGVGHDKTPFTCDDIVPVVNPDNRTGLLVKDMGCPTSQPPNSP